MPPLTVLLAIAHASYRDGVARAVDRCGHLQLVGACDDAEGALREIEGQRPDLCLADVALRPFNGLELCRRSQAMAGAPSRFVLLSSDGGAALAREARAAGAAALIDKEASRARLCELLLQVAGAPAK